MENYLKMLKFIYNVLRNVEVTFQNLLKKKNWNYTVCVIIIVIIITGEINVIE